MCGAKRCEYWKGGTGGWGLGSGELGVGSGECDGDLRSEVCGVGGRVAKRAGEVALIFVAVHGVGLPPP